MGFLDPAVEIHDFPEIPDTQLYRGHEGFRELFRNVIALFDEMRWYPIEYIDAGEKVVVAVHTVGRGHASGAEVEVTAYHVWTIRDGKGIRLQLFADRSQALEAAGLSE